ncbi:MAG TPA: hypothetical protein VK666_24075, partial [Chryseolinea sp.]|nr:hypothetical protein [Chryseolinea sp.]
RMPFSCLYWRAIFLTLLYTLSCQPEAISQPPIAKTGTPAFRYQSLTLVAWGGTHFYDEGQSGLQNIDQIVAAGVNDITLQTISTLRDTSASSFTSTLDDPTVYADIKKAALYAKSKGLTVTLKPHIQLKGFGVLQNASYSPSDGDAFFASVKHDLANNVKLANEVGAYMLVIGTEMGGKITSVHSENGYDNCAAWHKIIAEIRKAAPSLKLTYAATLTNTWNKLESNEAPRVCFWDALDFLGFDAYPDMNDLTQTAGPVDFYKRMFDNGNPILNGGDDGTADSVFSLHNFMRQYKITNQSQVRYVEFVAKGIRNLTNRPDMKVIITEVGTPSTTDAFQYWGSQAGTINYQAQAAGWDGVMKALTEIPMVEGINIWSVNPWHTPTDANNKKWQMDWDPVGKPAYQVIKKWFSGGKPEEKTLLWSSVDSVSSDNYVAFRGDLSVSGAGNVQLQVSGASWYVVWVDGKYFHEGPDRYHKDYPEYQVKDLNLDVGKHTLAVEVHYEGLDTRILKAIQPFLFCRILKGKEDVPIAWKCLALEGYQQRVRRINDQLGWVEWLDSRKLPQQWQLQEFDDSGWKQPVDVIRNIGRLTASKIANVKSIEIDPELIASGKLAEVFGYEQDNISARFFLRDLECKTLPPQGVWRRYDLGRIVLSRPKFVLDLPAGTVVEFGYCEQLLHGRVSPWIPLSASDSYNVDHITARGGVQEFFPLTPKGGRFMEIHIFASPENIRWISEKSLVRSYYDHVEGSFNCSDTLLN